MKIFIISSLLFLFVNKSECNFDFSELNIKNYELNTYEKKSAFGNKKKLKRTIISDKVYLIEFNEEIKIFSSVKTIFYVLRFENNLLEGYTFRIPVEDNEDSMKFYYNILKRVNKTKNDFINNEEQLAYMKTTNDCKRFFRFTGSEIFGGIHSKP